MSLPSPRLRASAPVHPHPAAPVLPETVPFHRPFVGPEEERAVVEALRAGVLHGDGPAGRRVQAALRELLGAPHVFFTTSCTHALEIAMLALGIGPGDEVIMPSFTFVSSANAVALRGATPVFADVEPGTMNLDAADVARRITPRTRAIVPVHYAGVACDMDALRALAGPRGIALIEDAAQAIDAYHRGADGRRLPLGAIGDAGCYSFHDTKNVTCGEGGAFVTARPDLARAAEVLREKGTNRTAFLRGEVDKYTWVGLGSSYVQSDVLAALLEAQLGKRAAIRARRAEVDAAYREALAPLAAEGRLHLPEVPPYAEPNHHLFFVRTPTPPLRDAALDALREAGIRATFHYVPLHSSPFGREVVGWTDPLPVTELGAATLLRLPLYPDLAPLARPLAARVAAVLERVL